MINNEHVTTHVLTENIFHRSHLPFTWIFYSNIGLPVSRTT